MYIVGGRRRTTSQIYVGGLYIHFMYILICVWNRNKMCVSPNKKTENNLKNVITLWKQYKINVLRSHIVVVVNINIKQKKNRLRSNKCKIKKNNKSFNNTRRQTINRFKLEIISENVGFSQLNFFFIHCWYFLCCLSHRQWFNAKCMFRCELGQCLCLSAMVMIDMRTHIDRNQKNHFRSQNMTHWCVACSFSFSLREKKSVIILLRTW